MDEISSKLSQFIAREILRKPNKAISPDDKLLSSGLIDSFHLVDLAIFIEDEFHVRIEDSELNADSFDTLAQLVDLVTSRQV